MNLPKKLLVISICLLFSIAASAQTFEALKDEKVWDLHLYQSLIRMLNRDKSDDFNKLIKDVKSINVLITRADSTSRSPMTIYHGLSNELRSIGEEAMTIDNSNLKTKVFILDEEKGRETWACAGYFADANRVFALKIIGNLNLKYLESLRSMDMEMLEKLAKERNL